MSVFDITNNYFELSEDINCFNIQCLENTKDKEVFADRAMDCTAYGNENNKFYHMNHNNAYLDFDKWITNKCNPYEFNKNPQPPPYDCQGFECNDDTFYIKPHNCHTYKNGLYYDKEKNMVCSECHQIWNNMKGRSEVKQEYRQASDFVPATQIMGKCKPIKYLATYR